MLVPNSVISVGRYTFADPLTVLPYFFEYLFTYQDIFADARQLYTRQEGEGNLKKSRFQNNLLNGVRG